MASSKTPSTLIDKNGYNTYGVSAANTNYGKSGDFVNDIGVKLYDAPSAATYAPTLASNQKQAANAAALKANVANTYANMTGSGTRVDLANGYNTYGNSGNYTYSGANSTNSPAVQAAKDKLIAANTSTGSGSGSGTGTGTASGDSAYLGYLQLVQAQQAAEQRRAEEAAAAQRAAAQNAYNRGMSYLSNALANRQNLLGQNFNSAVGQLENKYNDSTRNINADADASLRQAYINRMMSQKNLAQQMSAQGLSGGATESTMARMYNNYGNTRNNIENTRANNLTNLENTFSDNYANALQSYNNALAEAEAERMQYAMNLENALANNEISTAQSYQNALNGISSNYINALSDAVSNMARYKYDPTKATNDYNLATIIQAASNANSNYPNANRVSPAVASGVTTTEAQDNAVDNSYLTGVLRSLYGLA